MNFFKNYFLLGLLLTIIICPMTISSMDTLSKQDPRAVLKQAAVTLNEAQILLTKKNYNSKRAQELLEGIPNLFLKPIDTTHLDNDLNAYSHAIVMHTIEMLSFIHEQNGELDKALEYWNDPGIPEEWSIPQKFKLLFKHKKDNTQRLAQFDQIRSQLINLLQKDNNGTAEHTIANDVYGMSLIADGNIKDGIKYLEKISIEKSRDLSILQLYIAYKFGFDSISAHNEQEIFYQKVLQKRLQPLPKQRFKAMDKSYYFIQGFIKLFGLLGENKNISEGLKLIDEAENYIDDIYIPINELFPQLDQIRKNYNDEIAARAAELKILEEELWAEQPKKKSNPKQGKSILESIQKKPTASSSSSSAAELADTPFFSIATELTPVKWNNYFVPLLIKKFGNTYDGSIVKAINIANKTVIISDPAHNEELIVHASDIPHRSFKDIGDLDYDEQRIAERQNTDKKMINYVHQFSQMLDFVIQYVGDLVPFIQMGNSPQESLRTQIERVNLSNKKRQWTTAQYTFGRDFNALHKHSFTVVYHRVLKPNEGNMRIIETGQTSDKASSSGTSTKSKKK